MSLLLDPIFLGVFQKLENAKDLELTEVGPFKVDKLDPTELYTLTVKNVSVELGLSSQAKGVRQMTRESLFPPTSLQLLSSLPLFIPDRSPPRPSTSTSVPRTPNKVASTPTNSSSRATPRTSRRGSRWTRSWSFFLFFILFFQTFIHLCQTDSGQDIPLLALHSLPRNPKSSRHRQHHHL